MPSACLLSCRPSGRGGRARRALGRGACGMPGSGGPWRWAGGGFVGNYPLPPPPPSQLPTLSGPFSRPLPLGPPPVCPAPAAAPRAACVLGVVCWAGGAIAWPAAPSGDTLHTFYLLTLPGTLLIQPTQMGYRICIP